MQPTNARQVVAVLGRGVVPTNEPILAADDLGLTRGDGCFDATRVVVDAHGVRAENLGAHLARLSRSAERLEIACPPAEEWRALVAETLRRWTLPGGGVPGVATLKLILTRGPEESASGPTAVLLLTEFGPSLRELAVASLRTGRASDAFANAPWLLGGVKTLSYAVNVAAQREARRRGADDVLFTSSDGYALEGPTSGLVVAIGDGLVTTPTGPTGILPSITVSLIRAGALRDGVPFAERLIEVNELAGARAAWLVSSIRGVCPLTTLDGAPLARDAVLDAQVTGYAGF